LLEGLESKELPEDLREMGTKELMAHVRDLSKRRGEIRARIVELSKKRQEYIRVELAKTAGRAESSFEYNVFDRVRRQASGKSVSYDKAELAY
jgi:hypothetical protein